MNSVRWIRPSETGRELNKGEARNNLASAVFIHRRASDHAKVKHTVWKHCFGGAGRLLVLVSD